MNRQKLKSMLKEREIRHAGVVCTAKGFSVRDVSYRGEREIPYPIIQLLHIALTGHGYKLEINQRDHSGKTHYQFGVIKI